jgi:sarcosine oxidase/L-pipecolate oxidase
MSPLADSYLIIGSGVFGASTALHLSQQNPAPEITLVDRLPYPCPIAASHDINKIVRSDYGDIFYCKLGLKTLEKWRTDPLFRKWYHQSGLLKATDHATDLVGKIFENYRELGVDVGAELLDPEDLKTRFGGIYADTDLTDVKNLLWNPSCGWAEADYALKDTVQACVENGVHYVTASVAKLILKDGACTGLLTEDGKTFTASKVILSAGAYTAKLLADSAPTQRDLQVGDRIVAAGVCEAYVSLNPEQVARFKDVPGFVLDANETQGNVLKHWCQHLS